MLKDKNILVTGGAGCLGRAIARRRKAEGWTGRLTVYSRDTFKHEKMRRLYPDVQYVQGDVRNAEALYHAMVGHDVVLHLAACKVIPTSEYQSIDTYDVNVNGSLSVFEMAYRANIEHVLSISTDKACHPANAYGCSKMMMEKALQEYARVGFDTRYHLVRYGNVLESTGSVIEAWKNAMDNGEPVKVTDPSMTRFWLSPQQAVDHVLASLNEQSGNIFIPMMPALPIGKLLEYTVGDYDNILRIPLREGEKMHETLLTVDESYYCDSIREAGTIFKKAFLLHPSTFERYPVGGPPYTSDAARELTREELLELLKDGMA